MFRQNLNLGSTRLNVALSLMVAVATATMPGCGVDSKAPLPTPTPVPTPEPTPDPTPEPTPEPEPIGAVAGLYIVNKNNNSVTSYANPSLVNGNVTPDTVLAGTQTRLNSPRDAVVNFKNQLMIANALNPSVTTYDEADLTNGNLAPDGTLQGAATGLTGPTSLALNDDQSLAFVTNFAAGQIFVYDGADDTLNGNTAPLRTIRSTAPFTPWSINFGANDDLYVITAKEIRVFAEASKINGTVAASRTITNALFTVILDVFIDDFDTMYVVDGGARRIYTYFNASTLNGAVDPDLVLQMPLGTPTAIVVDSVGTAYIADAGNNAVHSYDNIDQLNGLVNPDRTIQGPNTLISAPDGIFLVE